MDTAAYENLIRQLCEAHGSPDATNGVIACKHLEVEGRLVGLIPRDDSGLDVFIELQQTYPDRDHSLYEKILRGNISAGSDLMGFFGLHPEGIRVVYRMRLPDDLSGEELSALLLGQIQAASQALQTISAS
ncbi:MAG: Tir chaperone protein (CesT) family [Ramlibacter sp.]|jgi:hypothetical protein|nr:Tir chaperone protein (CesT) family [Ramlibacter sp.]